MNSTYWLFKYLYNLLLPKGVTIFIGLGELSPTPEIEGHIRPVPTAVHFISENIVIICFWLILPAFSCTYHSPPNPGDRRMVIWVISICKLRSSSSGHRTLGQNHWVNWMGSLNLLVLQLAFQLTELYSLWGGRQDGIQRIFYFSPEFWECLHQGTSQWFLMFASFPFSICCM